VLLVLVMVLLLLLQLLLIFYWVLLAEAKGCWVQGLKDGVFFCFQMKQFSSCPFFSVFLAPKNKGVFSITRRRRRRRRPTTTTTTRAELLCSYSHASFTYFYNNPFSAKCMMILRQRETQMFLENHHVLGCEN
jgi:hypothetical protein